MQYQWSDYGDWFRKYGPDADLEAYADYATLLTFFEGLGVRARIWHDILKTHSDLVGVLTRELSGDRRKLVS